MKPTRLPRRKNDMYLVPPQLGKLSTGATAEIGPYIPPPEPDRIKDIAGCRTATLAEIATGHSEDVVWFRGKIINLSKALETTGDFHDEGVFGNCRIREVSYAESHFLKFVVIPIEHADRPEEIRFQFRWNREDRWWDGTFRSVTDISIRGRARCFGRPIPSCFQNFKQHK